MKKYFSMAWRNIWRNWRRTTIAAAAIVLGLILLIFMSAMIKGSDQAMFGNAVRFYGGNISIHAVGYREKTNSLPLIPLADPDQVVKVAQAQDNVQAVYKRINTAGMVSAGGATAAVNIMAVEPSVEENTSIIAENIIAGRYLLNEDESAILISKTLADYLSVKVGDRVSLLGQRKDESMRQHSMTVVGIYSLGVPDIEKVMIYMNLAQAQTLYNLRGQVTEVALSLKQVGQEEALVSELQALLPQYEVDSWKTLKPEITDTMQVKDSFTVIFGLVVLIIASIGILNLMLMAVFERTREMGVLAALGWKGRQIMLLFLLEGTMIGAVGGVIGGLLSWAIVAYLGRVGIDFTFAQEMGGEAIALLGNFLYPSIPLANIIQHVVSVIIIAAIASLIPAWQASKNEPAKALHHI